MLQVSSHKKGNTFPELLMMIFICFFVSIPVYSFLHTVYDSNTGNRKAYFIAEIRLEISLACSKALEGFKRQKIIYNKGDSLSGFVFIEEFLLKVNHYGQIEMGDSTVVETDGKHYMLKVMPVTGVVTMEGI